MEAAKVAQDQVTSGEKDNDTLGGKFDMQIEKLQIGQSECVHQIQELLGSQKRMSTDANLMLERVDRAVGSICDHQKPLFENEKRLRTSLEQTKDEIDSSSTELMKFTGRVQTQFSDDHSDVRGDFAWQDEKQQNLPERTGSLEQAQSGWCAKGQKPDDIELPPVVNDRQSAPTKGVWYRFVMGV